MSRVLIDTNAYSALMSGDGTIADELAKHEAVLLSPIVIGELIEGFRCGNREAENRAILERFRAKPRTVCIPITDATAEWFAEIKVILKRKGNPIPLNDVWIAASCMEHGGRLLTRDSHFSSIDGLLRC
ncbi:MAG: twitching motility protein PilT [Treponema sp. GWB1_62_6]|nr:MAG: twitching motility protein PilT [Treponema sp. GWA1_62_8]OHE64370.1 MAG: twitching motility protein PilT [Treponema sp. GWC1_61_84]OHE67569.1 MAG: twitching motility protein PilT [Treponema sp. GWB1_62_6]HCM27257.1 VapC toxin family PIN domain ribonuclease [Treponema sp.]